MFAFVRSWFQRSFITPAVQPLQLALARERSNHQNTAELLRESAGLGRGDSWIDRARSRQSEMKEAMMLGGSGPAMADVGLKERWWDLELALEDRGWARQLAQSETEFSRYGLQRIILISRLYAIKNPLYQRGIKLHAYYTFGRGFEVFSPDADVNEAIEELMEANDQELGEAGLSEKEDSLQKDGNLFWVFFASPDGLAQVRTIDCTEIAEIVTDPDDCSRPWFYLRQWQQKGFNVLTGQPSIEAKQAWYPALGYDPAAKPESMRGYPIMWDNPVHHDKLGGEPKWLFGCPPAYTALDWVRAAKNNLEDWATITRALARFAWNVETQGGQQAIQALQQTLATTLADGGATVETNPPPVVGSTFISGPGNKLNPIKTSNMTTKPDEVRRIVLMVACAFGWPETFFGDASVGTVATAQSLDRPTEMKVRGRQSHWKRTLKIVYGQLLAMSLTSPKSKLREAKTKKNQPVEIKISVTFPSVLEHDIGEMITAMTTAATLNGYTPANTIDMRTLAKLLMSELGVEEVDALVDAMYPPDKFDAEVPPTPPPTAAPDASGHNGTPDKQDAKNVQREAAFLQGVASLERVSRRLAEAYEGDLTREQLRAIFAKQADAAGGSKSNTRRQTGHDGKAAKVEADQQTATEFKKAFGMTPTQFHESMFPASLEARNLDVHVAGSGRTYQYSVRGEVKVNGQYTGIALERTIDHKAAEHDYFVLESNHGAGVGKDIFGAHLATYEKMGIEQIHVHANIDVGGYAWARYGFVPNAVSWPKVQSQIISRASNISDLAVRNRVLAAASSSDPKSIRVIAAMRDRAYGPDKAAVGFALLQSSNWYGTLNLKTDGSYARAYVSR